VQDLVDKKFGMWTVSQFSHKQRAKTLGSGRKTPSWVYFWICRCDCGTERVVCGNNLRRGGSKNCGCVHPRTQHGMTKHPAHNTWWCMMQRCFNSRYTGYELYGGRGITVCDRWHTFVNFWEDVGSTWQQGLMIDSIDNDGNYEPSNCKWSTPLQSANNRRTNHRIVTPKGRMTVTAAAKEYGLSRQTLFARIRYGWREEDLLLPTSEEHDSKGRFAIATGRSITK